MSCSEQGEKGITLLHATLHHGENIGDPKAIHILFRGRPKAQKKAGLIDVKQKVDASVTTQACWLGRID